MAEIKVETITSKSAWEDFMALHPESNFLHSWFWGEFQTRLNHPIERLGFYKNNLLVGVALLIIEPARRGKHLVEPGGPIIDWNERAVVQAWLKTIKETAKKHHCLFARVRPQLLNNPENRAVFKRLGFHFAPMHVTADLTSQLMLDKSDEELKKAMRKGARYELNRANKLGINVEAATDDRFLKEFCKLQMDTAKRQNFVPFSEKFLSEQFHAFSEANKVVMYRSSYQGKLLAMAFIIYYGAEAAYHYGASTELARELPGAYAIQWEAIKEARRRGCLRYNFWGVAEHGQTKHRFYGVSVFKRGFGGEDVAYVPAQDLIVSHTRYPLTYAFETARRKIRKL